VIKLPHTDTGPYLPGVGEVYWVDSSIIHPDDRRPDRPVLVVQVPASVNGRLTIVVRTSTQDRAPGIASPEDPELGLDQPGAWSYLRSVEAYLWTPSVVEFRGTVDLAVLRAVREEFGL
jgi:mRNA-degrading endonuclease toxin of MazEF toxin-antitoxin module